jgi:hypothetical protein
LSQYDLRLRLGEGTGAALAMGVIESAVRAFKDALTFSERINSYRCIWFPFLCIEDERPLQPVMAKSLACIECSGVRNQHSLFAPIKATLHPNRRFARLIHWDIF